MDTAATQVAQIRGRLRELLDARDLKQPALCARLTAQTGKPWLVARLSKILNGRIRLQLEDLLVITRAADVSLGDLVREPGHDAVDVTADERRLLEQLRRLGGAQAVSAVLTLLALGRDPLVATLTPEEAQIVEQLRAADGPDLASATLAFLTASLRQGRPRR